MSKFVTYPQGNPRDKLKGMQVAQYAAALEVVNESCQMMKGLAQQNLRNSGRVNTGILRQSIGYRVEARPSGVIGTVYVGADYGAWVEYGRAGRISNPPNLDTSKAATAAWPPVDAMIRWVKDKAKTLAPSGRTKSGRARKAKQEDIESLAYLVGRKIANFGIAPSPFMGPAFAKTKQTFLKRYREALARIKP